MEIIPYERSEIVSIVDEHYKRLKSSPDVLSVMEHVFDNDTYKVVIDDILSISKNPGLRERIREYSFFIDTLEHMFNVETIFKNH